MNRPTNPIRIGFIAAVGLLPCVPMQARANELLAAEQSCPGSAWPWTGQGPVVNIPTQLASQPVTQTVGMVFALTLVPIDLVIQGVRGAPSEQNDSIPKYARIGLCGGVLLGKGVALAAGAPFWMLKEIFWDFPRGFFVKEEKLKQPQP